MQELALFYLPYSTGFEIECCTQPDISVSIFDEIPYLIENKSEQDELKFRIPPGIEGLHCLSHISLYLRKYALMNLKSGIHYHIDFTDVWNDINVKFIKEKESYILKELESWNYKGTYNRKEVRLDVRCWVKFHKYYKTMEVRIGEMTFEYELLFERIRHCNAIAKKLKEDLLIPLVGRYDKDEKKIVTNRVIRI